MTTIVFATQNPNKVREVQEMLPDHFKIKSLADIGCNEDIPETQATIEGNAIQKATYVYEKYGVDCFAEDTGLEVAALNGAPGIYTARYAGPQRDSGDNMDLLLKNLEDKADRSARFKTVIALILDGKTHTFEGIVDGQIAQRRSGKGGFGYDPVFLPEGQQKSFAEMNKVAKNAISHRGRALSGLLSFFASTK
ncbi:MAG TPA: non-canonical purine NTP diphosphatase [Saprospiraceae bacterium]|nr:non-canonical purine NTP diphosphatase [Saprospiraceae bacterium]